MAASTSETISLTKYKGNCFAVMDKLDYDTKMEALLGDHDT